MTRENAQPRETPASNRTGRSTPPAAGSGETRPAQRDTLHQKTIDPEKALEEGLEESFPGSDPVSVTRRVAG